MPVRRPSAAMTGAILTKFGRAPTTWTTWAGGIGRAPKQIDLARGSAGHEQFRHAVRGRRTASRAPLNRSSDALSRLADRACRAPRKRTYHAPPMPPSTAVDDRLTGRCLDAALVLSASAARADFRGADPFDGLWWGWPRAVVGGRRRRQAVVQAHARSPVDVRRLYRRRAAVIAKALGVFASV